MKDEELFKLLKDKKILKAGQKNNILYIETEDEVYETSNNFLTIYEVYASLSRYRDPIWGIREKVA